MRSRGGPADPQIAPWARHITAFARRILQAVIRQVNAMNQQRSLDQITNVGHVRHGCTRECATRPSTHPGFEHRANRTAAGSEEFDSRPTHQMHAERHGAGPCGDFYKQLPRHGDARARRPEYRSPAG